jgi:formylglycine-generating enzyme required for sulfatase activity
MPASPLRYQLLAEILSSLEAESHRFGVDQHLRWQELLSRLPEDLPPEGLREVLCPLIAGNEAEQEQFGALFRQCLERVQAIQLSPTPQVTVREEAEQHRPGPKNRLRWLLPALLLLAGLGWLKCPEEEDATLTVIPQEQLAAGEGVAAPAPDTAFLQKELPYPLDYPHDIRSLAVEPPSYASELFRRYHWLIKSTLLLLLAALLWTLLRWREQRRRKLIAELDTRVRPPYIWNIRIKDLDAPELGEDFTSVLNRLRRRTGDESYYLDIPRTIAETVRRAGFAALSYGQHTRPPEYLLLIDRQGAANHRAQLFDTLCQSFRDNGVHVDRFFFDGDLRSCRSEAFPDGLSLQELQHKHPASRLLILSNGYQLLSPLSGQLSKWTEILRRWKQRTLLSPTPTDSWGRREARLGELFILLPASLQALGFLVEELDAGEEVRPDAWRQTVGDAPARPIELQGGLIATLRDYYSEELLQWIAACAVYPSLHYDLTRYLGGRLGLTVSIAHLMELSRLPWFAQGKIPGEARAVLLDYLEREHPGVLLATRQALHELLQQNQPPADSLAYEEFRMSAALNEWLITKDKQRKKALEQEVAGLLDKGVEADFTVVKYLDRERSPLDFVVPDAWKKYLHRGGHRALGFRDIWRDLLRWALPLWLLAAGLAFAWWQPPTLHCAGALTPYKEMNLCLDSEEDEVLYREFLLRDSIDQGYLPTFALPFPDLARPSLDSMRRMYRANTAVALYNRALPYARSAVRLQAAGDEATARVQKDSACLFFERGLAFDSSNYDLKQAGAWCKGPLTPALPSDTSGNSGPASNSSTTTVLTPALPSDTSGNSEPASNSSTTTVLTPALPSDTSGNSVVNPGSGRAYPPGFEYLAADMVRIPGGEFDRGDLFGDGDSDEKPVHRVRVNSFYLSRYEVTQAQWKAVMGDNPSSFKGCDNCPVESVSWNEAQEYLKRLNQRTGGNFRLPTEAEWEYAAREKGRKVRFGNGKDIADPREMNFDGSKDYKKSYSVAGEYREKTVPVNSFAPNALGLYNMSGNVWEWCSDWYGSDYYRQFEGRTADNPKGPASGKYRVCRGGSWYNAPFGCRAAGRDGDTPDGRRISLGFRLAQD